MASCGSTVSQPITISHIAVYVHEEINGTFDDIFDKLSDLVNCAEFPNNGSITEVSLEWAKIFIEDIGACPASFEEFLSRDSTSDKSIAFIDAPGNDVAMPNMRHPLHRPAESEDNVGVEFEEDLPTEDLLATAQKDAVGFWVKKTGGTVKGGYMVHSKSGDTFPLTSQFMKKRPIDREFNVWFKTRISRGWKACAGRCSPGNRPKWYNIGEDDPPPITREMKLSGCAGLCAAAGKVKLV